MKLLTRIQVRNLSLFFTLTLLLIAPISNASIVCELNLGGPSTGSCCFAEETSTNIGHLTHIWSAAAGSYDNPLSGFNHLARYHCLVNFNANVQLKSKYGVAFLFNQTGIAKCRIWV